MNKTTTTTIGDQFISWAKSIGVDLKIDAHITLINGKKVTPKTMSQLCKMILSAKKII